MLHKIFVSVCPLIYVNICKYVKTYLEHAPLFLSTCRHNVHFKFSTFIQKKSYLTIVLELLQVYIREVNV